MGTPVGVFTTEGEDAFSIKLDPRAFTNAKVLMGWLDEQPPETRVQRAESILTQLLQNASSSRDSADKWCVKLCGFVQQCTKSKDASIRQWAFTEPVAMRLCGFYLDWYEHDSHRSMRLVLDVLIICITLNPHRQIGVAVREQILRTVMTIVAQKSARPLAKSSLQVLNTFLDKNIIGLGDISRIYNEIEPLVADSSDLELWRRFTSQLFSRMEWSHVRPVVGKIIVSVFRELRRLSLSQDNQNWTFFSVGVWREWLQDAVVTNPATLEGVKSYVLVPIFKTDETGCLELLRAFNRMATLSSLKGEDADSMALLQLAVLELGKKYGLVDEPGNCNDGIEPLSAIVLHDNVLESLLCHPSSSIRSSAFSLLVPSHATTKALSEGAITLLKKHLAAYHADYDAKLRNDIVAYSKDLIKRVKSVIAVAKRRLARPSEQEVVQVNGETEPTSKRRVGPQAALKDEGEAAEVFERHSAFLNWYLNFLKGELIPTASYQRHITAAKITYWALKVGKEAKPSAGSVDLDVLKSISSDPTWFRLILDLMLDPFDDVRESATAVLAMFQRDTLTAKQILFGDASSTLLEVLREFCNRAHQEATRTGRADHGDGAARSQGLLCGWLSMKDQRIALVSSILDRLEGKLAKAGLNLGSAAIENPVHGDFSSIGYVWQVLIQTDFSGSELQILDRVQRRILKCCEHMWEAARPVLCDDSPEGFLPEELEEGEGLDTKDLLSYSFRAVRESSALLRVVVAALDLKPRAGVLIPAFDIFRDAGYLTFDQLSNLRHRGAFSTVSYTFATCCQLTQRVGEIYPGMGESGNLLREWYQGTLSCIEHQASTTRRSAGIPALMTGILGANASSPSFQEVFLTLNEIASKPARITETDGSNLPQVHALNCLRAVFRSSLLSKKAEIYLGINLKLAANSLKSEVWAIRNCGLLLLRSLIDTLFGTGESKEDIQSGWDGHTTRISYRNYPALPGVLLSLLRSAEGLMEQGLSQTSAAEAVFPVLDIIRRAGPPDENHDELRSYIEEYLGSHLWHVREIAARTLCSFLLREDWVSDMQRLICQAGSHVNRLHGSLLALKFVLERKAETKNGVLADDTDGLVAIIRRFLLGNRALRTCPEIRAAYLEILNLDTGIAFPGLDAEEDPSSAPISIAKSALLSKNRSVRIIRDAVASGDLDELHSYLMHALNEDVNTACAMLDAIPGIFRTRLNATHSSRLTLLYIQVCMHTESPEPRAQALLNLSELVDDGLKRRTPEILPDDASLLQLWGHIRRGEINPTLSCAIIRMSGSLMAVLSSHAADRTETLDGQLRNWGAMMSDALDAEKSFDVRHAAAIALKSFAHDLYPSFSQPSFLPFLSALYDALNDDDAEVREIGAAAAGPILGTLMTSFDAAESLLGWLGRHFGADKVFRSHVACRMVGSVPSLETADALSWPSAETQLQKAMELDDSLFPVEEQNLFIDEVRETRRWGGVLRSLDYEDDQVAALRSLRAWTEDGLRCLIRFVARDDGPLGWTSDQHVFAICARVLLSATILVEIDGRGHFSTMDLLAQFRAFATRTRFHGSLLALAAPDRETP